MIEMKHNNSNRHCEERSDEAIQNAKKKELDCFATLAMTNNKAGWK
jgi:hypothetical protein